LLHKVGSFIISKHYIAAPTIEGATLFENKYGLPLFLIISIHSLGPVV